MTEETNQVNINVSFEASKGTWLALSAAGAMMVVGILIAVTLGVGWMTTSLGGSDLAYGLGEMKGEGGSGDYDAGGADFAGTGLITTGYILAIISTVTAFVTMAVLAVSLFLRRFRLTLVGSILAAVTTLMFILTVILAPIGMSQYHGDFEEAVTAFGGVEMGSLAFGAGLIIGIIAAVLAIGATVASFVSLRDPVVS